MRRLSANENLSAPSGFNVAAASLKNQFRSQQWILIGVLAVSLIIILGAIVIALAAEVPLDYLTRDPASITSSKVYYGLFTYLNIMLWTAAGMSALLSFLLLRGSDQYGYLRFFLFASVLINGVLLADDTFLLHEGFIQNHLGIPQVVTYGLYGLMMIGYLGLFHRQILSSDYLLLVCAAVFLGGSIFIDLTFHANEAFIMQSFNISESDGKFIEDCLKLIGTIMWTVYFVEYAVKVIPTRFQSAPNEEA